jgi:hypothetical protein
MSQNYSNPKRENEPHSLPDVETFYLDSEDVSYESAHDTSFGGLDEGWYYWHCLPGCLPDSDPIGPFESEEKAIEDAQADSWQFEDED